MKPMPCDINLIALHHHEVADLADLLDQVADYLRGCDHDASAEPTPFGGSPGNSYRAVDQLTNLIGGHAAVLHHRLRRATT